MDIDLSAEIDVREPKGWAQEMNILTTEQQPECSPPYFTFDRIQAFV